MEKKFNIVIKNKKRIVHENIKDHGKVECPICNREITPYWEHGIMALGQHVMFVELIGKNHEIKTRFGTKLICFFYNQ
jgi:hypothetical protein